MSTHSLFPHNGASCATPAARAARAAAALLLTCALGFAAFGMTGCAGNNAAESQPAATESATTDAAKVSVQVVVDSSAADGSVSYSQTMEFSQGATALDALKATGLDVVSEDSEFGAFVTSVGGLANGQHGDMSGWMYKINGEFAEVGCDAYELSSGETLTWEYSVG